jgi:hypothetical protein
MRQQGLFDPARLVFVDETAVIPDRLSQRSVRKRAKSRER